ncbi:MAG: proton-conducting transporter membrane subunit [Clostridia bacterium]
MNLFEFTTDGFRIIQLIMTISVFLISSLFSLEYFKFDKKITLKFLAITAFVFASVVGVFLSATLLSLFVCFEIMSISSYLWVIFEKTEKARSASMLYLVVSLVTGMVTLVGVVLLNNYLGTTNISEMLDIVNQMSDKTAVYVAAGLTFVGFFAKAGLYPLHIWMADAYTFSPAPATAMLSSVLSKAGVFGVIVVASNIFLHNEQFGEILIIFALLTMIWGGFCATNSQNLKTIMAFSSMSQLGFVFLGIAMQAIMGEENLIAINGTTLHMLNHSVFKLILFTLSGVCAIVFGSANLEDIKGIGRKNKIVGFAFTISGLGLAGMPFLSGYVSKTLLHESIVEEIAASGSSLYAVYEILFLFAGALTASYVIKVLFAVFSSPKDTSKVKLSPLCNICLILPCLFVVAMGIMPNLIADSIAYFGSDIMHAEHTDAHAVSYFTYENIKGALISLGGGVIIYFVVIKMVFKEIGNNIRVPHFLKITTLCMNFYKVLMFIFKIYITVTAKLVDAFLELLVSFGMRPSKTRDITKTVVVSYEIGEKIDKTFSKLHIKHDNSYANDLSEFEKKSVLRRRMIAASLSYGLLISGLGTISVLIYLMFA